MLLWLVVALCWSVLNAAETPSADLLIEATRIIDVSTQIVKNTVDYELKNKGKSPVASFMYSLPRTDAAHLAWISAHSEKKDGKRLKITEVQVVGAPADAVVYRVDLLTPLQPSASVRVFVRTELTGMLRPYPEEITQLENQFVVLETNAYVFSPHVLEKESTSVKYGSGKMVEFTQVQPVKQGSGSINYGPFTKTAAYSKKTITIHYENNAPFLVVKSLNRWIEVSHWGNIAVEESIEIEHRGAKLKGQFSRLDYQMDRRGGRQPVVKSFKTHLPVSARDIYYRDQIGNISTSVVSKRANRVEVELRPRFPLFGGWRTNYVLGYNVPSVGFLHSSGSDFALRIPFIDHVYDNVVIEKATVRIVLPEASRNIKLVNPYSIKQLPDENHKTYLDTVGRPVIVLEKENMIDSHSQQITVYYEFDRVFLLRELVIASCAFFIVFLVTIIAVRCDFSITQKAEVHQKKE